VYSIAHDLRAPLRSISGCAELLKDQSGAPPGEDNRMLLERMQTAVHFMDKLLLDLLEFGRTARARLDLTKVEVKNAWDIAVFQNASAIKSASARVETIPPLLAVRAHEPTLGQALANLLGNALKFVEPGVQPSIRLRTEQRGESVRIWVEDNGIGISPAYIDRIFGVFERVHSTRFAGSGIGLSIVRKGIERMGGRVGVESEPGKGSRFWIELPKGE
ncbi:MAG TPA: HAMP domain-containing sensor histidine kinase, partial [Verrucomicrobiae bacterium]|nr:HAMP domain-containing sensor histidine kinase [Verrucomicrobiae bacterium]